MVTSTEATICGFDEAWIGPCKQPGSPLCDKHSGRVCTSCGSPATRNCPETGQFVCGENLCNDCEHTIFPSGTNGGIGFNAEPLTDGMSRHCKKAEQRFKSWYAVEEKAEQSVSNAGMEWLVHKNKREIVDERGFYVAFTTDEATAIQIVADHKRVTKLEAALKALDDYYQASGKVWDDARAVLNPPVEQT